MIQRIFSLLVDVRAEDDGEPRVHIGLNGVWLPSIGPFSSMDEATRAARWVVEELTIRVVPNLHATLPFEDIADKETAP